MEWKTIALFITILTIFLILGGSVHASNSEINLGNSKILIPDNFQVVNSDESIITVNDGENNISLSLIQSSSVDEAVQNYTTQKSQDDITVEKDVLNLSGNEVIRTVLHAGNSTYVNYWFETGGNIYLCHFNPLINENYNLAKLDNSISLLIAPIINN